MDIVLEGIEVRIIGCLIEKEMTTPEYYPLSLNSLTNACNQKSNRSPVVSYDEGMVEQGLDGLQEKRLARKTLAAGSRVAKYLHTLLDRFDLSRQEMAVLCELMLRGPQTVGELRSHTERMSVFQGAGEAEETLRGLEEFDPPMVLKLPREAGRKESRYMHLFSGGPEVSQEPGDKLASSEEADDRIGKLEEEISGLRAGLEELRQAFNEFKSQF